MLLTGQDRKEAGTWLVFDSVGKKQGWVASVIWKGRRDWFDVDSRGRKQGLSAGRMESRQEVFELDG